jgi:hypothetical protein
MPINGNIFPRGRIEMEVTRVSYVGPGTGGLDKTAASTRTMTGSTFARFTRTNTSTEVPRGPDGKELLVGNCFIRFELNMGVGRLTAARTSTATSS